VSRSNPTDRLFLDANVLFSASYLPDNLLRQLWDLPDTELMTSAYARREARRRLPPARHRTFDVLLRATTIVVSPPIGAVPLPPGLVLPPKDVPIFAAAVVAAATHLLTGDKRHFGPYYGRRFNGVLIMPPAEYLRSRGVRRAPPQ
jgi:hypothetical protein